MYSRFLGIITAIDSISHWRISSILLAMVLGVIFMGSEIPYRSDIIDLRVDFLCNRVAYILYAMHEVL